MCTSVYTPCSFIDLISCFIPSMVCSLSKPSVLFTQGSRRIFSACISCSSSLEVASIFCPFFVVTVTVKSSSLLLAAPEPCQVGLAAVALSVVLACFGELPCVISSVTSLLPCVGMGSACFACCVAGAVAIGRSVSTGGVVVCGCTRLLVVDSAESVCLLLSAASLQQFVVVPQCLCCWWYHGWRRVDDVHQLLVVLVWLYLSSYGPCSDELCC